MLLDLGIGNIANVKKALDANISDDIYEIERAEKIVLPGVGNFGSVSKTLEPLKGCINDSIQEGKPFLGICLGMHLLFEKSEESKGISLEFLKGKVLGFRDVPAPHIGWNQIYPEKNCKLLQDIEKGEFFYYVHSYYVDPVDDDIISATTEYEHKNDEVQFPAVVSKENLYGVQFHPEKSSKSGLRMMKNFKEVV